MYLQKKNLKEPKENYIFFDFECTQESGTHVPNFCIAQYEKGQEFVFSGENTLQEFGKWLFSRPHKGYTAIAHNAKGYDSVFLMQYILKTGVTPDVIMDGKKYMCITHPHLDLRIIDSLNFIPMALNKFPKTFGLDELKKGYFPHLFNTSSNQEYCGPMPAVKYYCPETMSAPGRKQFMTWYNDKVENNYVFNFRQEMEKYCRSDVDILRRACMQFRKLFLKVAKCDPFQYLTIASVCMAIFRCHFLEEKTLAMIPVNGYGFW